MKCPRCRCDCNPIDVHGHRQCNRCGSVIDECCQGEQVGSHTPGSRPSEAVRAKGAAEAE